MNERFSASPGTSPYTAAASAFKHDFALLLILFLFFLFINTSPCRLPLLLAPHFRTQSWLQLAGLHQSSRARWEIAHARASCSKPTLLIGRHLELESLYSSLSAGGHTSLWAGSGGSSSPAVMRQSGSDSQASAIPMASCSYLLPSVQCTQRAQNTLCRSIQKVDKVHTKQRTPHKQPREASRVTSFRTRKQLSFHQ